MENITHIDGARIRALRLERHWTQKQLAVRSGIDQSIISKLEHQTKPHLNAATVMALTRALDVTVEDLVSSQYFGEAFTKLLRNCDPGFTDLDTNACDNHGTPDSARRPETC